MMRAAAILGRQLPGARARTATTVRAMMDGRRGGKAPEGFKQVLFIETGVGKSS